MQPISISQNPSSRIFTESELKLQAPKTPHELGLKPFSKTDYTYYSTVDKAATDSIINDIHAEVQNGEKYFFLNTYSPFVAKQKQDKKIEWLSVDAVNANQVLYVGKAMTKKGDQSFYINTGSHGSPNGDSVMNKPEMATNNPGVSWKVGRFILEDVTNFATIDNVAVYIVPPGGEVRYPANANQHMIAWCYSYRTAQRINQIVSDNSRIGFFPNEFRCDLTSKVMQEPTKFSACTHLFEKAVIDVYMNQPNGDKCPAKTGWFSKCNKHISLNNMEVDQSKKQKIKMLFEEKALFEENKRRVKELEDTLGNREAKIVRLEQDNTKLVEKNTQKATEIVGLKTEGTRKDAKIGTLKASNDLKDQKIEEDAVVIKAKDGAIEEQEKTIAGYKKDPNYKTIQERFIESPVKGKYSDNDWTDKLSALKYDSALAIKTLMLGSPLARSNAFVSSGFSKEDAEKHKRIIEKFLEERKQDIAQLVKTTLDKRVALTAEEFDQFFKPLMEKLSEDGYILGKTNTIAEKKVVSLKELPIESWDQLEPDRFYPKTYETSLKETLKHVFMVEICDQLMKGIGKPPAHEEILNPVDKPKANKEEDFSFMTPILDGHGGLSFV